ncbi:hypothetical protein AYJ54_34220 [Bradyrhizobium centrolobii]|uniref:Restriction endonuclease type IV Mrr domain-containing protein n=1 Tax=Bradyrhizobium centrolobii TaxID=1505087 RepID=A0A176Y7G7_9BRAD|nr:hypothetical protein [Bradyrhizobium centrolobii]OAE98606.1 hypothetical protein AYJ54_34220 [Bradyrhizobium centrolobii]
MKWRQRTLDEIADMICGNGEGAPFVYRSSSYITRFFRDADTDFAHGGSTRAAWVSGVLEEILSEPHPDALTPPATFCRVIATLMDVADATDGDPDRSAALSKLNVSLAREGFEAFYATDQKCYLRHIGTGTVAAPTVNPHRPLSKNELKRRELLTAFLDKASEDELIGEVLLPLFRQLGFHRVTAVGHRDKSLEYGKDIWMRYTLPTQHVLYFGLQVKRDKLDAAAMSKNGTANVGEIFNQVTMMLGHEIFDPETSRRVLVDHAFIVAGGEITKAARNWLGERLDASKRSQVMFMDRVDILNLFVVTNVPLPQGARRVEFDDDIPF